MVLPTLIYILYPRLWRRRKKEKGPGFNLIHKKQKGKKEERQSSYLTLATWESTSGGGGGGDLFLLYLRRRGLTKLKERSSSLFSVSRGGNFGGR